MSKTLLDLSPEEVKGYLAAWTPEQLKLVKRNAQSKSLLLPTLALTNIYTRIAYPEGKAVQAVCLGKKEFAGEHNYTPGSLHNAINLLQKAELIGKERKGVSNLYRLGPKFPKYVETSYLSKAQEALDNQKELLLKQRDRPGAGGFNKKEKAPVKVTFSGLVRSLLEEISNLVKELKDQPELGIDWLKLAAKIKTLRTKDNSKELLETLVSAEQLCGQMYSSAKENLGTNQAKFMQATHQILSQFWSLQHLVLEKLETTTSISGTMEKLGEKNV